MEMLKNQWKRRRGGTCCVGLSFFVVCVGTMICTCMIERGDAAFVMRIPLGAILGCMAALLVHLFYATYMMTYEFNLAVSMSVTRKHFLQSYLSYSVLEWLGITAIAFVLGIVEKIIYNRVFDGAKIQWNPSYGILILCVVIVAFTAIACETFLAACAMRYGWNAMWGVIAVTELFLIPNLVRFHILPGNVLQFFLDLAWLKEKTFDIYARMDMMKMAVLSAALLFIGYRILKKQRVTYR